MKDLLLLRHAKSSWEDSELSDFERPLNARGKKDAPRIGKLILKEKLTPHRIISSSAVRARSTADIVAEKCQYKGKISFRRSLYAARPQEYFYALQSLKDDYTLVLVVGHNPAIIELIELLTGMAESIPTCALAHIKLPVKKWKELRLGTKYELVKIWRPKELSNN
jgi:phosphohistidine phosphatase